MKRISNQTLTAFFSFCLKNHFSRLFKQDKFMVDYSLLNEVDLPKVTGIMNKFAEDLRLLNFEKSILRNSGDLRNLYSLKRLDQCISYIKEKRLAYAIKVGIYKSVT